MCISKSIGYNIFRAAICDSLKFKTERKLCGVETNVMESEPRLHLYFTLML